MGFLSTATTITITTKLTRAGRDRILKESNNIFSHFILGDSDANYHTSATLPTGTVPTSSGTLGRDNAEDYIITSKILVNATTATKKAVESNSSNVTNEIEQIGIHIVSGDSLNYVVINRSNTGTDFTNLFKSFSLPILGSDINIFTGVTAGSGGWANTAFSGFGHNPVLVAAIDNDEYGEIVDGKNIRCQLPIATGYTPSGNVSGITTYDIYGTFPSTTINRANLDNQYEDESSYPTSLFGNDISVSYLVSDNVQRPNNDPTKSWSRGYETFKPFSLNNKSLININSALSTNIVADRVIGVAYLDKGFLVFTDPEIVSNVVTNFSGDTETGTLTNILGLYHYTGSTYNTAVNSIDNNVVQNIVM